MPGLEHVPRRTADEDLAAQRLDPRELEIAEARLRPSLGEIARGLGLVCVAKDAQRDDLAFAAVYELVGGEARLSADLLGEAVVDASRQLLDRSLPQAVAPDARKHSLLPSSGVPKQYDLSVSGCCQLLSRPPAADAGRRRASCGRLLRGYSARSERSASRLKPRNAGGGALSLAARSADVCSGSY